MKVLLLLMAGLPIYMNSSLVHSSCPPRPKPQIESPKDYLLTLIDTIAFLRTAADKSREIGKAKSRAELRSRMREIGQVYECGMTYTGPYYKSHNKAVEVSSLGMNAALSSLVTVNDGFLEHFRPAVDGIKASQLGEIDPKVVSLAREAWSTVGQAASSACLSLVDYDPVTFKRRSTLTDLDRAELINKIEKSLRSIFSKDDEAMVATEKSGKILLNCLRDKKPESPDEEYSQGKATL